MKEHEHFRKDRPSLVKGFTLIEVLITVGIAAILCALGTVAVVDYVKTYDEMKQDAYAEQVYVAVQNQITQLQSSGIWDTYIRDYEKNGKLNRDYGELMTIEPSDFEAVKEKTGSSETWTDNEDYMLVLSYNAQTDEENKSLKPSLLNIILPSGAISDSTRKSGQYFIEYNIKTGKVFGVWYTDRTEDNALIDYETDVTGTEENTNVHNVLNSVVSEHGTDVSGRPLSDDNNEIVSSRLYRREHKNTSGENVHVGYYSGLLTAMSESNDLKDIDVEVLNGEELRIVITDPNSSNLYDPDTRISYEITGRTSKITQIADISYALTNVNGTSEYTYISDIKNKNGEESVKVKNVQAENVTVDGENRVRYTVTLDSITSDSESLTESTDLHFADMFKDLRKTAGENITVKAVVKPVKTLGSSKFKEVTTNSLYGDTVKTEKDNDGNITTFVDISQMRHLENLDPEISATSLKNISATLSKNITFDGESKEIEAEKEKADDERTYTRLQMGINYTEKNITACSDGEGNSAHVFKGFNEGSYIPVNNDELNEFQGDYDVGDTQAGKRLINNVQIKANKENVDIADKEQLERISNIGIFGIYTGEEIKNVGVINFTGNGGNEIKCIYEGYGNIGGLIGTWKNDTEENEITAVYTFANVRVKALGGNLDNEINSGGLIGKCTADKFHITDSYAGGLTNNRVYQKNYPNISCPDEIAENVRVSLGGIVGNIDCDLRCYRTFSAASVGIESAKENNDNFKGTLNIGGLFGRIKTLTLLSDSYMAAPLYVMCREENASYDEIAGKVETKNKESESYSTDGLWYLKGMGVKGQNKKETFAVSKSYKTAACQNSLRIDTYPVDPYIDEQYPFENKALTNLSAYYGDWSMGNASVTIEESEWPSLDPPSGVKPGGTYSKDPKICADDDCTDVYVFMEVAIPQVKLTDNTMGSYAEIGEGEGSDFEANKLGKGWVKVEDLNDETVSGVTYKKTIYAYTLDENPTVESNMRAISGAVTEEDYRCYSTTSLFQDVRIGNIDLTSASGKIYSINIKAHAVQKSLLKDVSGNVYTKAIDVWNAAKSELRR